MGEKSDEGAADTDTAEPGDSSSQQRGLLGRIISAFTPARRC